MTHAIRQVGNEFKHQSCRLTERKWLLIVMLLAVIVRGIGANSELWFDEIATVANYVRLPFSTLLQTYGSANNHVLNSILAHLSVSVLGSEQPWIVRLPSILFGIGGVWAFYFVALQLWSSGVALMGTLLFALSYHDVYYTQQARGYSMFLFFALVATGLLLRMVREPERNCNFRFGLGYAIAVALGAYSLLLMSFVIMGHGSVLLITRRWKPLSWLIMGVAMGLILYAPMLNSIVEYYWKHPAYTGVPLVSLAFLGEIRPILPALIIGAIILPFSVGRLWNRFPLAIAILLAPAIFNTIVPVIRGQGLHPRSFIFGLPVGYLLLTELVDWARSPFRWCPALAVAAVSIVSLAQLIPYYSIPKQGFRQALDYVAAHRAPDDRTIGLTLGGKAVRFYEPSVMLIDNAAELHKWLERAHENTWIIYSFENEMRSSAPELYNWVIRSTINKQRFPSIIGDGSVYVRLWTPR